MTENIDKYISFNSRVAAEIGVNEAIMLNALMYWVDKNKANEKHLHEGKYWTYNSIKAFTIMYPFWSVNKVRTILRKLKDGGYIETSRFNQMKYDQTTWYTLTPKAVKLLTGLIWEKSQIEVTENPNVIGENPKPIPRINQYINQYIDKQAVEEIIGHMNKLWGTHYKVTTKEYVTAINARLNGGATVEEMKSVIDYKTREWINKPDFVHNLNPITLTRPTNYKKYVAQMTMSNKFTQQQQPTKPPGTWGKIL